MRVWIPEEWKLVSSVGSVAEKDVSDGRCGSQRHAVDRKGGSHPVHSSDQASLERQSLLWKISLGSEQKRRGKSTKFTEIGN
jgi:hypothetical protein